MAPQPTPPPRLAGLAGLATRLHHDGLVVWDLVLHGIAWGTATLVLAPKGQPNKQQLRLAGKGALPLVARICSRTSLLTCHESAQCVLQATVRGRAPLINIGMHAGADARSQSRQPETQVAPFRALVGLLSCPASGMQTVRDLAPV